MNRLFYQKRLNLIGRVYIFDADGNSVFLDKFTNFIVLPRIIQFGKFGVSILLAGQIHIIYNSTAVIFVHKGLDSTNVTN